MWTVRDALFNGTDAGRPALGAMLLAMLWMMGGLPASAQDATPAGPAAPAAGPKVSAAPADSRVGPVLADDRAPMPPPGPGGPMPPGERIPSQWYEAGYQATFLGQNLYRFRSPYQGSNSLRSRTEFEETNSHTAYLGVRPTRRLDLYLNPEWSRGRGISGTVGLAGYTSGEVIRAGIKEEIVLARSFGRWTVPVGKREEKVEAGENQIAGTRPAHRLVLTAGKLASTDLFDVNRYANNARTQFMNWTLITNGAYDYNADTRGYSRGLALEWAHPDGALRLGSFQMPTVANGPNLAGDLLHNRGDQIEGEVHPHLLRARHSPLVLRLLGYRNLAHMGNYRDALALARRAGTTPDITAVEKKGAVKYGFGLNFEQALGDEGNTGVFGRLGWDDGATETFAFTECDRTLSLGGQVSGAHWRRPQDHWAVGLVQNGLAAAHRDYLAAGGIGFQLGDGRLRYGPEQILETYYAYAVTRTVAFSPDYQWIRHPGYNRDRGPVSVFSFRVHWEF
jgi:high affinity Mn2+ porin